MRRTRAFRLLGGILGLWTPLITGAVSSLPSCPMHGSDMHGMADMASMGAAMEQGAPRNDASDTQSPTHQQHQGCTCVCCCPVASATLRAPDGPTVDVAYVEISSAAAESNRDALLPSAPEFSRPYGRGPPRA